VVELKSRVRRRLGSRLGRLAGKIDGVRFGIPGPRRLRLFQQIAHAFDYSGVATAPSCGALADDGRPLQVASISVGLPALGPYDRESGAIGGHRPAILADARNIGCASVKHPGDHAVQAAASRTRVAYRGAVQTAKRLGQSARPIETRAQRRSNSLFLAMSAPSRAFRPLCPVSAAALAH